MLRNRPDHDHKERLLAHVRNKIRLTEQEEEYFLSLFASNHFYSRTQILNPGDQCHFQYFVVNGCLRVFYLDEHGEEHNVKFAIENWWAFDIASFFESIPAYYGISALEDTAALQLNQEDYHTLLDKVPAFERFYKLMLQQSFIALQHRITQFLAIPAEERYVQFQLKYPGLESRISQRHIASYLGITPVFLSMLRKRFILKH